MTTSDLGKFNAVVLQEPSTGNCFQCSKMISGDWGLKPAPALTLDEAVRDSSFWMRIEATREYISIKCVTSVTDKGDESYVQFSAHGGKMTFTRKTSPGVREQLEVLQCNKATSGRFNVVLRPRLWGSQGCIKLHVVPLPHTSAALATHVSHTSPKSPQPHADALKTPDLLDLALRLSRKFASRACGLSRTLKSVFAAWRKLVIEAGEQERKARQWHRNRMLRLCMKALVQHRHTCKELNKVAQWQRLLLQTRAFIAWKSYCLIRACHAHNGEVFSKRMNCSVILRAFRGWARVTHQRFVNITLVQRLQRKWMQRVCTAVLRAWAVGTSSSRHRRKLWNRVHISIEFKLQRQCLCAWWNLAAVLRSARNVASFVHKKDAAQSLQRCFRMWKHAISEGQQRQQRYIQASTARVMQLLAKVWEAWQLLWMQGKRHKRMIMGVHVQQRQRALSMAFRSWLQFLSLHKYQHMLLQGFVQRTCITRMANVLHAWRLHSAHMQHLALALEQNSKRWRVCCMWWTRHQMRCMVLAWSSLSKPYGMAIVHAKRFHLKKLMRSWHDYCTVGKSTRKRQYRVLRQMIHVRCHRCLKGWQAAVCHQKLLRRLHDSQLQCTARAQNISVLSVWQANPKAKRQKQQACAVQYWATHLLRTTFVAWVHVVVVLRSARFKLLCCLSRAADGRAAHMFEEWFYVAHRQKLIRRAVLTFTRRRFIAAQLRIWLAWKDQAARCSIYNGCLESAACILKGTTMASLLLQSVLTWRDAIRADKSMKQIMSRRRHRVRFRIQRVAFSCWNQERMLSQQRHAIINSMAHSPTKRWTCSRAAFLKWRRVTAVHWSHRRCLHRTLQSLLPTSVCISLLQASWNGWLNCTELTRQQAKHRCVVGAWAGACIKRVHGLLSVVLRSWQKVVKQHAFCRKLQIAALRKAWIVTAGKVLRSWRVCHQQQVHERRCAMIQAVSTHNCRVLCACLSIWRSNLIAVRRDKMQLEQAMRFWKSKQTRAYWTRWVFGTSSFWTVQEYAAKLKHGKLVHHASVTSFGTCAQVRLKRSIRLWKNSMKAVPARRAIMQERMCRLQALLTGGTTVYICKVWAEAARASRWQTAASNIADAQWRLMLLMFHWRRWISHCKLCSRVRELSSRCWARQAGRLLSTAWWTWKSAVVHGWPQKAPCQKSEAGNGGESLQKYMVWNIPPFTRQSKRTSFKESVTLGMLSTQLTRAHHTLLQLRIASNNCKECVLLCTGSALQLPHPY